MMEESPQTLGTWTPPDKGLEVQSPATATPLLVNPVSPGAPPRPPSLGHVFSLQLLTNPYSSLICTSFQLPEPS